MEQFFYHKTSFSSLSENLTHSYTLNTRQPKRQPSSSSEKIIFTPASHGESRIKRAAASRRTSGSSTSTPNNGKHLKSRVNSFSSPACVASSDFSSGGGSGSSHTPSSPTPPRHKKLPEEGTEMWYAKWWMCGFTDALNLNSKC